ncbi:hypothetical protein AGDE_14936 [Angomonas deanei]|uniref:Uncharacterized protein n=1 Tax=Angomonas deanei TaxID=59799 RepID=A0A7G2CP24_9TRYP|nr:hypothetical protein AGDE_14936 [Angomonas deanei]CAD2220704.1 hypothetical protein, conserved [Angomonas deanei]|eukprot:EPY19956.1 hypothetical protein AGDE_14936 [Angomonas deanei]
MESLLEIYLGCDLFDKVKELLDFLQETYTKEVAAGRLTARPIPSNTNENNEAEESFLPPRDMCIALLADLVSEAAGQHCAARGEGSTSKFVLTALAPIVKALGPPYTGLLLEALLHNMEEQLIMAVGDSAKVNPSQKHVMLAVSVAFFKAVLARRLYEVAPDPLHYEYHTLSKLYFALRKARRVDESLLVADQLLQLYRAHSSLHQTRMMERELTALARTADKETVERRRQEMEAQLPLPPQPLDDCDRDYRTTYFAYVNDTAIRSLADGRRVCLACVEEFPYASTPWRTLSLILWRRMKRKT